MNVPSTNAALTRREDGAVLARVRVCRTPWARVRGLIGHGPLPVGVGIAIPRCGAIHTAFVRYPIDVLFLREGRVVGIADGVRPWRIARSPGAQITVELAAGAARRLGISVGDALVLRSD